MLTNELIRGRVPDRAAPPPTRLLLGSQVLRDVAMHFFGTWHLIGHIVAQITQAIGGLTDTIKSPVAGYLLSQEGCPLADGACPNGNISYFLYTRETQNSPFKLDPLYPDTIRQAKFVKDVPLKVLIHGYTGNKDYSPNMELRPEYFKHGEYNILSIDWGPLAKEPCYWEAAHNVDTVGRCAAELMDLVYRTRSDVTLNNTHFIGFSLGAHTAATLASNIRTGKPIRLTCLDPALPLFDGWTKTVTNTIGPGDARFVDVYHSNVGHRGMKSVGGNIDIYFNNGVNQPGCDCNGSCNHVRSVEYYAESINSLTGMWGFSCWSWTFWTNGFCKLGGREDLIKLGEHISPEEHGIYLVFTNSSPQYLLPPSTYFDDVNITEKIDVSCSLTNFK